MPHAGRVRRPADRRRMAQPRRKPRHARLREANRTSGSACRRQPQARQPPAYRSNGSRAGSEHRPTTLRDSACRVGPRQSRLRRTMPAGTARLVPGLRGRLPGRQAERFRMGPEVVLGQDLAEAARPVRHGAAADLAARDVTGRRVTVTGKRREWDLLIASMMPVQRDGPCVRRAHAGRQIRQLSAVWDQSLADLLHRAGRRTAGAGLVTSPLSRAALSRQSVLVQLA